MIFLIVSLKCYVSKYYFVGKESCHREKYRNKSLSNNLDNPNTNRNRVPVKAVATACESRRALPDETTTVKDSVGIPEDSKSVARAQPKKKSIHKYSLQLHTTR